MPPPCAATISGAIPGAISGRWSKPMRQRLDTIFAEYGPTHFVERFPNAMTVLQSGPDHPRASHVCELLVRLTSPESVTLWRPALARRLILETLRLYRRAGGPGDHADSTPEEREAYWEALDELERAEREQDFPAVQRTCQALRGRLPRELWHLAPAAALVAPTPAALVTPAA